MVGIIQTLTATPGQVALATRLLRAVDEDKPNDFGRHLRRLNIDNQVAHALVGVLLVRTAGEGKVDIMKQITDRFDGRGLSSTFFETSLIRASINGKKEAIEFLLSPEVNGPPNQMRLEPELLAVAAEQARLHFHPEIEKLFIGIKKDTEKKQKAYVATLDSEGKRTWLILQSLERKEAQASLRLALSVQN